ncbi:MAG TPA: DUF47 family protein, partial [Candidatus Sulfotelmatobacter sp.]|nr:DUF47 family protein [Candidatus Sulfotelmatobacter sp.]
MALRKLPSGRPPNDRRRLIPSLIPRERRFYELFDQQMGFIVEAAELLVPLLEGRGDTAAAATRIRECEHACDDITHEIVRTLNRTFVTPFDREDIYGLASGLDDVMDFVDEVAAMPALYSIKRVPSAAQEMANLLLAAAKQLQMAIRQMETLRDMEPHWIEIHRLENAGDTVSRRAIAELFKNGGDGLEVIKLKELYDALEKGMDRCEDVAN